MTAVLLDTDIGSDIDDAVALAYLLARGDCELVGITTVSGDTAKRAACARALCNAAGRDDVPIVAGLREPSVAGAGQPDVPQFDVLADSVGPLARESGAAAVDFLRKTVHDRPGEIVLLTIGPFTNIAALFAADPEIPSLLAGMVSMAGDFATERVEWNVRVDPVAAAVAYRWSPPGHISVGYDVTTQVRMPADEVRNRFAHPALAIVLDMAEVWFRHTDVLTFHDPLAAALVFEPGLCTLEPTDIEVELDGPASAWGHTVSRRPEAGQPAHHRVTTSVDADAFFADYAGAFAP